MGLIDPRVEKIKKGEEAATRKVVDITKAFIAERDKGKTVRRDAHPKHQGVVRGTFVVRVDRVPKDLRWGLFARNGTYPCWIRFSNGAGKVQDDKKGDGRGMAIKVCGVEGVRAPGGREQRSQDFVMIDHPVFFIRDAGQYQHFVRLQKKGQDLRFFIWWNPCHWHLRQARIVGRIKRTIPSLLVNRYFSMAPHKHGPLVVKYACESVNKDAGEVPEDAGPQYLREDMIERLEKGQVEFDFTIQTRTHADRMPVEDPTRYWSEELSPYRKVARVIIHKQTFDSKEQMDFGENISLNPWHSLLDHAPLGGLNRMRLAVYNAISDHRHALNDTPNPEPDGSEFADNWHDADLGADALERSEPKPEPAPKPE